MNEIIFIGKIGESNKTYRFSDADGTLVQGATASMYFSPLGDELRAPECVIPVIYEPAKYQVEPSVFQTSASFGAVIKVLQDNSVLHCFYLKAITGGQKLGNGRYQFEIHGTDFFGLYVNVPSNGGMYPAADNYTIGSLLCEMLGLVLARDQVQTQSIYLLSKGRDPRAIIDAWVYNMPASGYLPATNDVRENIRYILQAAGAYLSTGVMPGGLFDGNTFPYICGSHSGVPTEIPDYEIYAGDQYVQQDVITEVVVNEHSYLETGADPVVLYEANNAVSELVVFDGPHYDLAPQSIIEESGANYAIVTGTGTLTGRPVTITTRQISQSTGLAGEASAKTLDNPLVGPLNSAAMLQRMVNYYANAKVIKNAIKAPQGMMAGDFLRMTDPMDEVKQGYPREVNLTWSGIDKAVEELVVDWTPIQGDVFTQELILDASGTLTVPDGATLMRLILIQGGKGGWGGYKGGDATNSTLGGPDDQAGDGGAVGEGGSAGKVTVVDVQQADLAASYTVTVGAAGTPGAINHGEGTEGGHSSAVGGGNTYTSSDGVIPENGIADPMTGERYAINGSDGIYPGKPGVGTNYSQEQEISDAETGVSGVTVWRSGTSRVVKTGAHGGGGPAYGSNGQNAGNTYTGDGADAALDGFNGYTVTAGTYGSGGLGGNGGGGGGGTTDATYVSGGTGGNGSVGGPAAGGAVIALFAFGGEPVPVPTVVDLLDHNGEQLYDSLFERLRAQEV